MQITMKKWGNWLLRAAKWLAVGFAALAVLVVSCWYFLPDETLLPAAQAALDKKPQIPSAQNAFYPLLGLTASPELDATAVGIQIAKVLEAAGPDSGTAARKSVDALLGSAPFQRRSPQGPYCRNANETASCLDAFVAHHVAIEAQWKSAAPFIQRYRALRALPDFEETSWDLWGTHGFGEWFEIAELVDAKIALDMATPALRAAALGELHQEILLTLGIVRQSDSLITQQVFAAQLRKKLRLAADLLSRYPDIALTHADAVAQITQPLKPHDVQLKRVMLGEFRTAAAAENRNRLKFAEMAVQPEATAAAAWWRSTMWRVLYKPNATINMLYRARQSDGDFYSQSAVAIQSALGQRARPRHDPEYAFNLLDPRWILYNPMGKIMASMANGLQFQEYGDRLNDLLAFSRLLELERQMLVGRISPDHALAFVANAGPALANPYTEQPMQYDPTHHTLTFSAKSQRTLDTGTNIIRLTRM